MQGNVLGQSNNGSSFINGIIEEYQVAAGENINAGDLVEYVNGEKFPQLYANLGTISRSDDGYSSYSSAMAVKLNDKKVFIIYSKQPDGSSSLDTDLYVYYGRLCLIEGNEIKLTDKKQLALARDLSIHDIISFNENKVIAISSSTSYAVFTINNLEISLTKANETIVGSSKDSLPNVPLIMLNRNEFFMLSKENAFVITVNADDTLIVKNKVSLELGLSYAANLYPIKLSENKIFLVFSDGDSACNRIYGKILSIEDENIVLGTNVLLANEYYQNDRYHVGGFLLKDKVVVCYRSNNSYASIYSIICSVTDNDNI